MGDAPRLQDAGTVVVFGMARSGVSAARLALACGVGEVVCTDLNPDAPVVAGTRAVYGHHDDPALTEADLIIVSPGVPPGIPPLQRARAAGVPVVGELHVAAAVLAEHSVPLLAVTGTNGKSSTVWLLQQVLEQAGLESWVGGNLGEAASEAARAVHIGDKALQVVVVEVSSYQLETSRFRPRGAAVLNLTPDHLARHRTMAAYGAAKMGLFAEQGPGDLAVLPSFPPPELDEDRVPAGVDVLRIGGVPGCRLEAGALLFEGTASDGIIYLQHFGLPGEHNALNLGAAVLLAQRVGVTLCQIDPGALQPLPHRMAPVCTDAAGVTWINDSKATNVDAALVGISAVSEPTVFLLGGQGKQGADYTPLASALLPRARQVICFGATGPAIAEQLAHAHDDLPVRLVDSLADAVSQARAVAAPGDTVLLSPACASFDAFTDFAARGNAFAALAGAPPSTPAPQAPPP